MQVNQLNIADYIQKDNKTESLGVSGTGAASKTKETTGRTGELRSVSVQNPTYGKSLWGDDETNSLAGELAGSTDATQRKNEMVVASNTTTDSDYEQMQKDGYTPMDMEKDEFVNVADKIKMQLAKAGADVSKMGGINEDTIAAITGSETQTIAMAREVRELSPSGIKYMMTNELEPTIEHLYKASFAEGKTQEMNSGATPNTDKGVNVTITNANQQVDISGMEDQIAKVIQEAGLEVTNDTMKQSQWMLEQQIPLTAENLRYYNELAQFEGNLGEEEILSQIVNAVQEGRQPEQAYLIPGYSIVDQAQIINDVVANATETDVNELIDQGETVNVANLAEKQGVNLTGAQAETASANQTEANVNVETANVATDTSEITAYRQLEEIRLIMTTQANYALMKQGIAIDTESLQQLIEQLKTVEASMQEGMPANLISLQQEAVESQNAEEIQAFSAKNVEMYLTFTRQVADIQTMPADILGEVTAENTVSEVYEAGVARKDTYEKANASYEALMTAPRRDMGDSIQKAFQNVDDILDDLGLEKTEANQRAVRILGYNSMDITAENISKVKAADEQVQRLFKNMTPAVVTEMMKENINPLDMSIDELNNVAEEIGDVTGSTSNEEKFSKYLYRLEVNNDITEEERESFIGMYRLIHQVEATDGAAIGSLLQQGADITMRNLMTAVRSEKHSNLEYGIDDSFGMLDSYDPESLSITQQIEVVYQSNCIKDAGEMITPEKMAAFENEDSYMGLTPEGLVDAFRDMEGNTQTGSYSEEQVAQIREAEAKSEAQYNKNISEQVSKAVAAEDAVYEILEQFDVPTTPTTLAAMTEWMSNKNDLYKKLLEPKGNANDKSDEDNMDLKLELIKEQLIEDYGEAIKTPKEMAEAQRKLEEVAENAMRNVIIEQDVTSIDVRGMKLIKTQISSLGQIANKQETYNIPIMVADELGNMTLKIVRGEDQKGLADIAFDTESTGVVTASFRYENGMVDGEITSERANTREMLADHMGLIAQNISEGSGYGVSLRFAMDKDANTDDILTNTDYGYQEVQPPVTADTTESDEQKILTTTLYGIAKSFVDTLGEIA